MTTTVSGNTASWMTSATEKAVWLHVDGIVCYACVGVIESLAEGVAGVTEASASYVSESLRLKTDSDEAVEEVVRILEKHGYRARRTGEKEALQSDGDELKRLRRRIVVSFFLSLLLVPYPFLHVPPYVQLAAATLVQLIAGRMFYRDAYYAVSAGTANMSVLVSVGALSAYVFSTVSVLRGSGAVFYEASGTVLVLVMLGKYLERSARVSSAGEIRKLLETGPVQATLLTEAGERVVPAEEVRAGDVFLVHRGGVFPADGVVISGASRADESALTGENRPAPKAAGDRVLATTINMEDKLTVRADRDYADSVFSSMRRALLSGVSGQKAGIQRLADRVCARFLPAVLGLALLTLCLCYGSWAPGDLAAAVTRAAAVLIVACPCAMGIATPLAMTTAVGRLGGSGIFVKSPAAVERLAKTDAVVFDKTGTLTVTEGEGERLREGARKTVETLQAMGIELWLLTGDRREAALKAAAAAGIPEERVLFELLPEEKNEKVRELQRSHTVCMVGDGVNDALSLQTADVGIAVGRAAEVSVECADLVITQNRITHLLKALYIGRVTLRNIRRSLFWALIYNVIGLGLCVAGVMTPVYAGAAMSLSSLSVVLNARSLDEQCRALTFEKIAAEGRRRRT